MGSSLSNDDTDYGDLYLPKDKPFDMVCPQLTGKKPNAYQSACVIRLTAIKVDRSCRQCEEGREVLSRAKPDVVVAVAKCSCSEKAVSGGTKCQKCRDLANKYWRNRNPSKQRICTMCNTHVGPKVLYCDKCRPIAAANSQVKREATKKKKKLLYRQEKIARALAEMK